MFPTCIVVLFMLAISLQAQHASAGREEFSDVIDHTLFDSLWHEAVSRGKLNTSGWSSEAYQRYRNMLAAARPMEFLPRARTAFWINAFLACLLENMHLRTGYRSTVWDTAWLARDTFLVATEWLTLHEMRCRALKSAGTALVWACLPTGSSTGAPLPSHAAFARTVRIMMRDQMRRICRSERYLLYDPAGRTVQLSRFFEPLLEMMKMEAGSVVNWVLPYVTTAMAAQLALHGSNLRFQVQDVIETWRKARPP